MAILTGTGDAQPQVALIVRHPQIPLTVWILEMQLHTHGRVFEDQRGGLDQNRLPRRELTDEDITGCMKQQQAGYLWCGEAIQRHAERIMRFVFRFISVLMARGEPDVAIRPAVIHLIGRRPKENVRAHPRLDRVEAAMPITHLEDRAKTQCVPDL